MRIENIDGELKVTDPNKPSSFDQSSTEISINGDVLSATCKKRDGSPNKSSIILNGIENIDGELKYTDTI
ncbi:CVNH domain-containing protein [Nostoc sp.]|uniref:CVNH domain-containing protein n=1 Tax=Nostoc sp. TaxID=1180 RepID=UPI002FFCAD58